MESHWVNFQLDENNQWKLHSGYVAEEFRRQLPPFPDPSELKYHERDLVQVVTKYGESKEAAVDNIFCQFIFDKPKDGWVIFYDLKWTGTGHTHGWFLVEEFSPITA